jgi:hypothetical protein
MRRTAAARETQMRMRQLRRLRIKALPREAGRGNSTHKVEGWYDIRLGAAGYAPIVGAFGALSVPAIVLLFTVIPTEPSKLLTQQAPVVTLAGGLLIVVVIASLTGAIGLAAVGAERDATANLVPAAMFLGVAVSVSLIAVLAAFAAIATLYLPDAGSTDVVFAVIVGVGGIAGAFFVALSVADSWQTGPATGKARWLKSQWLQSYSHAYWWTKVSISVSVIPALAGIAVRLAGITKKIELTTTEANYLVILTLAVSMIAVGMGAMRTRHTEPQKGLRKWEALSTPFVISCYALIVMIFLP